MFKSFQNQWTELDQQTLPWGPVSPVPMGGKHPPFSASRALDILIASCAILFLLPLMIVIAVAIKLTEGGPVFFRHRRVGYSRRQFECLKFRTMHVNSARILADHLAANPAAREEWQLSQKLQNDPRVSPLGLFLRVTSMDELPQLFNVLRGDMALVGPRPVVTAELRHYGRYARYYFAVRPGLTGLWQVSGRSNTSYRRRVAYDVTYVRSRSIATDFGILARTIPAVMMARGSY
ncbi:MAG TPA: sugar transferase [Novosphingobium sp.]